MHSVPGTETCPLVALLTAEVIRRNRPRGSPLRGFAALHLASAMTLSKRFMHEDMFVGCWDARLWDCFQQEGFTLIPAKNPGKTQ